MRLLDPVRTGNLESVKAELDAGANPNEEYFGGQTALMIAAEKGHAKIVEVLLDRGASVNACTVAGPNALMYAVGAGKREVIKLLLMRGARTDVSNQSGETPLIWAKQRGDDEIVEWLNNSEIVEQWKTEAAPKGKGGAFSFFTKLFRKTAPADVKPPVEVARSRPAEPVATKKTSTPRCSICGRTKGPFKEDRTVAGVMYWCQACVGNGYTYAQYGIAGGPEDTLEDIDYTFPACPQCGFRYMTGDKGKHGGCPACSSAL